MIITGTRWVKLERFGSLDRGKALIRHGDNKTLGTAEPYRGGGMMKMVDGEMHYPKGWWITVNGLDPMSYTHMAKTLKSAKRLIIIHSRRLE